MQRANLRKGLLAGVTLLALGGCSFFHHRDDRSDSASAQPRMEQQGSSQQSAANNRPAQGSYGGSGAATMPSGNAASDYSGRSSANGDDGYRPQGAGASTRAGGAYAANSPYDTQDSQTTASEPTYADGVQRRSGSTYSNSAPSNGVTSGGSSFSVNGAQGTGASGTTGSGPTIAPGARRGDPSAMNDATPPNGAQGDNPSAMRGSTTAAGPSVANRALPGNGVPERSRTPMPDQSVQATGAPQPLMQNNTRNQMQNQTGLVDVNLNNVKVDVAKNLNIDASKIPVTVQLPVTAAANVCGVDVNALAAQKQQGGGTPTCMANNANEATQAVQTSVQ